MQEYNILWADDEVHLLKPHILFLEQKGYRVTPVNNGADAVKFCKQRPFNIVFLDEHMLGMSGLEALYKIKTMKPSLPVIMITKDEEERVMEEAIGNQVDDYLIKPINRSQILSAIKKIIDNKRLVMEKKNLNYQQDFREIDDHIRNDPNHEQWVDIYKRMIFWELQLDRVDNREMAEVLKMQKVEANASFCRFVKQQYQSWLDGTASSIPLLSHQVMKNKVLPQLDAKVPCFFLVVDNLRLDQWEAIKPTIEEFYTIEQEEAYYSILPTTTSHARNAIFSGMLPANMAHQHADWWNSEGQKSRNDFEKEFMDNFLKRNNFSQKFSYHKIKKAEDGRSLATTVHNLFDHPLNAIVYNFVDMLSHARTDMAVIKELASDEAAYRSLTQSWITHSPLLEILKNISKKKAKLIIIADHGSIRVKRACKVAGPRDTNTNLRYKQGKNLNCENAKILRCAKPAHFCLPSQSPLDTAMFAVEDQFFVYPNNYNHYANMYTDTFQHGGISLEEMIVPLITLTSK